MMSEMKHIILESWLMLKEDLGKQCIRALEKKIDKGGYHNIDAQTSSVSDSSFKKGRSVDFVIANGLI